MRFSFSRGLCSGQATLLAKLGEPVADDRGQQLLLAGCNSLFAPTCSTSWARMSLQRT
jgi:hypothetical protein